MNTLRTFGTARRFSLAAALCGISLLLGAGCVFLDGNGAHGLNERMEVKSVYVGRDYMFDLVKAYAD